MQYQETLQKLGITLTKSGKQTCPKCSAHRKHKDDLCLSVTYGDSAVLYKCHNCDFHGAVFYRDKFERKKNFKRPPEPHKTDKLEPLYKYFEHRGISKEVLDKYKISLNSKMEIIIPYYKYGELVNVKYRKNHKGGTKTFRQEAETEKTLFGMDLVTDTKTLIWVEGEMDVLALAQAGIYSVSIPQGASENKLECIENCYEFIKQFDTHIIAVDNDTAGDKLKTNLLSRLGKENCKTVNWKQYKDANEALLGGEDLKEFIDRAEVINPDGIIDFADIQDDVYSYNFEKDNNYFSTGWKSIDEVIKIRTGYMMIVSGYPSRGKSTFVDNLLMNLSKKYGMKHLVASFETPLPTHYNTLLEMYEEKPIYKKIHDEGKESIFGDCYLFIMEHFYMFDIDRRWTVDEIIAQAELGVRKYGAKTLVIDPYNRLDNNYKDREDRYIGDILSKLSMLARKLDILVIFVAHPRKPDGDKLPNMFQISGSGDWYNMADYGIIVHRSRHEDGKLSNMPTIFIEKVKTFFLGNPSGAEVQLMYDVNKRVLKDLS